MAGSLPVNAEVTAMAAGHEADMRFTVSRLFRDFRQFCLSC
jgi:hypothetical protein